MFLPHPNRFRDVAYNLRAIDEKSPAQSQPIIVQNALVTSDLLFVVGQQWNINQAHSSRVFRLHRPSAVYKLEVDRKP